MTRRRRRCQRCGEVFRKSEQDPKRCASCFEPQVPPVFLTDDDEPGEET